MPYDVNHIGEQVVNSLDGQVKIYHSVYGLLSENEERYFLM